MKKIFFLGYGGGHINTLIPVIKAFDKDKNPEFEICVIGINLAVDALRKNGIVCKTLSDYMDDEILEIGHPLALKYHNFNSTVSYADSIAYYGFSMRDLINRVGREKAMKIFQIYDRRLFLPTESMKTILRKENPDVVVVTTMHRFEAATILAARELGIPSVKIEDLVGNVQMPFPDKIQVKTVEEYNHMLNQGFKKTQLVLEADLNEPDIKAYRQNIYDIYLHMQPDRTCVLNNFVKNRLINQGKNAECIVVTGQPAFDKLQSYSTINSSEYINALGLNPGKPIFSFMSQPIGQREEILRKIIIGIRNISDLQFIIKLHPNEDGNVQRMILKEMDYQATIVKDIDAAIISKISTVTSTVSSTTGLEAACLDKNLVYFNFSDDDDFVPYQAMGIGVRISKVEEIEPILISVIGNSEVSRKMKLSRKEFVNNIGKAADNVKRVIEDLLEDGNV